MSIFILHRYCEWIMYLFLIRFKPFFQLIYLKNEFFKSLLFDVLFIFIILDWFVEINTGTFGFVWVYSLHILLKLIKSLFPNHRFSNINYSLLSHYFHALECFIVGTIEFRKVILEIGWSIKVSLSLMNCWLLYLLIFIKIFRLFNNFTWISPFK